MAAPQPGIYARWNWTENGDFEDSRNWRDEFGDPLVLDHYPGDGSTLDTTFATTPPSSNQPTEWTYHFIIENSGDLLTSDFLNGAAVGNVSVVNGTFRCAQTVTGNLSMSGGEFMVGGDIAVVGTSSLSAGRLWFGDPWTLDLSSPLAGSDFTLDWSAGKGIISGGINATNVTHEQLASGNALICDVTGTLKLGAEVPDLPVTVSANTVTLGADLTCGNFILSGGTLAGAFNVNANGNLIASDGTNSCTGTFSQVASGNVSIAYNQKPKKLRLGVGASTVSTLTGGVQCDAFEWGEGTVTGAQNITVWAAANDFWNTGAGALSVNQIVLISLSASLSQTSIINASGTTAGLLVQGNDGALVYFNGGVLCGTKALTIRGYSSGACIALIKPPFSAGNILLGHVSTVGLKGGLDLYAGMYYIGSLARANASDTDLSVGFSDATIRLSGVLNGLGFSCNNAYAKVIGGELQNVDLSTKNRLLAFFSIDGGGNQNVVFTKVWAAAVTSVVNAAA